MNQARPGVPPTLNATQFSLWQSRPDIPHHAVHAVLASLGPMAAPNDLLPIAEQGTLEAAATYDYQRGGDYFHWAFNYATLRVWEWLRGAHGNDPEALARVRTAMFRFLADDHRAADPWAPPVVAHQTLQGFSDGLLMAGHLSRGGQQISSRGEEDVVETEAARLAGEALRKVTEGLTPEQRRLLEQCHADGYTLKQAANEGGKGYRAVLREFHELLALMGARLAGMGIKEMPPWEAPVSGEVFDEKGPPANDGGRGT